MIRILFTIGLYIIAINSYAQQAETLPVKNPPVSVESVIGNRGATFQTILQKKFQTIPKLGIFGISDGFGGWNGNQNVLMIQGHLTYEFAKGFNATAGFHLTDMTGIRPAFGIMYSYSNPNWLIVLYPIVYIDDFANLEGFGMVEFKPKISDQWRLYTRVQGDYNITAKDGSHGRSYARFRLGLSWKEFAFGTAINLEYFGPNKNEINNYGGFISFKLF